MDTPEQQALNAKIEEQLRDLEGIGRAKDAMIETLRNKQCDCLPVVEAERDRLREENMVLRKRMAHMRMRMSSAAKMLIEDLDEDQLKELLSRIRR